MIMLSGFGIGFAVSIIEAICTGQLYVPILVMLIKSGTQVWASLFYLLIYNLLFITPLIIVFWLAYLGTSHEKLQHKYKKHVGLIKLLFAILFFIMGIWLLV